MSTVDRIVDVVGAAAPALLASAERGELRAVAVAGVTVSDPLVAVCVERGDILRLLGGLRLTEEHLVRGAMARDDEDDDSVETDLGIGMPPAGEA